MKRNKSLIQETAEKAMKVEDILRGFLELKITHIVMNERLFAQWVNTSFSPNARMLMHQFMNRNLDMLYARNGYCLYVVKR
jgi:phage antirepressor YoqD-like protein